MATLSAVTPEKRTLQRGQLKAQHEYRLSCSYADGVLARLVSVQSSGAHVFALHNPLHVPLKTGQRVVSPITFIVLEWADSKGWTDCHLAPWTIADGENDRFQP